MLTSYITDTANLLNDPTQQFYSTNLLTSMINRARLWMSVRSLQPRALITTLSTVQAQETYSLSLANSAVAALPGYSLPYGIVGISCSWGSTYMQALGRKDFPSFNADDRILNGTLQNYPVKFATYNRGALQVAYLFPVPNSALPMWWDIACTPTNLALDTDPEAIPLPWTFIVPFKAAALAYRTQRRWADADALEEDVDILLAEFSRGETPFMRPDWYPQG